jgi:tRNA-guanine family transglycosylase
MYLDSGAYEAHHRDAPWTMSEYYKALSNVKFDILTIFDRIPSGYESDIISDMRKSLQATVKLVGSIPKTLVIQKTEQTALNDIKEFIADVKNDFDILGIPKIQCGPGSEGFQLVRNLREFMADQEIFKPIHIFGCGSLELIPKFVEAGADIFDSNTWIYTNYHSTNFSESVSDADLMQCHCAACASQRSSNIFVRRFSHTFLALRNAMELMRQGIKDDTLIQLTKP